MLDFRAHSADEEIACLGLSSTGAEMVAQSGMLSACPSRVSIIRFARHNRTTDYCAVKLYFIEMSKENYV
jgi:hypothetical protein